DRDYRVGEVRPQERQPALPRLYGPLRLRTHGGDRRDEKPQEYAGLDTRFVLREGRDGATGGQGEGGNGRRSEWEKEAPLSVPFSLSPRRPVALSPRPSSIGVGRSLFVRSRRRFIFEEQDEQGQDRRREDGRLCP